MVAAMSTTEQMSIAAMFVLAGMVKGVTGLGLPTVGVGLLSLMVPPAEAAALVVVPALVTNLWQMLAGHALVSLCLRLWPLLVGICLGTLIGGVLLTGVDGVLATLALGVALLLYALLSLVSPHPPRIPDRLVARLGFASGVITGLVTCVTGVFVIPAVPYLQALALGRPQLIQALGLSFTVSTLTLTALLATTGRLGGELAWISMLALGPALLGLIAGDRLGRRFQRRPSGVASWRASCS